MIFSLSASGRWSQSESKHHINYLELLASFHGLQCFVSNSRSIHVRLTVDNSTAVAYINCPAEISPRGEIPRRHPNSRVY